MFPVPTWLRPSSSALYARVMGNIDDISHSIGRLESKVDTLLDAHKTFTEKFDRHDERLKGLEGNRSYLLGVVAALSLIFTLVVEYVKERILGAS